MRREWRQIATCRGSRFVGSVGAVAIVIVDAGGEDLDGWIGDAIESLRIGVILSI